MKRGSTARIRLITMLAFVAIAAIGFFTAIGIGNVCGVGFDSITMICPLGALLVMIAQRTAIPLALVSVCAAIVICALLGKVFCAWACPVHFMVNRKGAKAKRANALTRTNAKNGTKSETGNAAAGPREAHAACATCAAPCGKEDGVKIDSRHAILAAAVVSTLIFGFPVFCLACPVGLTFALVLLVMRLFAFGETTWTIVVFLAIIVAEVVFLPNWCKRICPLGALQSLFSGLNKTFRPAIDTNACLQEAKGADCNLCIDACHEKINLHDIALGETTLADCSKCRACADACPVKAITFPFLPASAKDAATSEGFKKEKVS